MSHEDFKKIIDSARQILVGKLPNPQDQIDAITYAMMYKFMNDIDDRSASLPSGKRTYFADDYEKYSWHNLIRADGQDQLILYREAIEKMSKNPGLPVLFREIFNGAILKFNDPRTLRLFLKEMDKLTHGTGDHIGDAYEYLLSLMSSQGGLGQFRTPRHIIKFIVDAVDPEKDDKIIDPAAGTAGFLIAAYEHILHKHDGVDEDGRPNTEKRLSSAELDKIHNNFRGFDIDATMIRTARVNMYLHGFKTPDIIEHDSLTSEDYWNDRYDVILANPPFMTPKGGIQPHKRFSINAKRAEVLFVDYIASHLKPEGRAGIVVPESIIFQSGKAYKDLRKNLIENGLFAVVSLPTGVFLPYADARTSILLIDKKISQQVDKILFLTLKHFGQSLTTRVRKTESNDLPEALNVINEYRRSGKIQGGNIENGLAFDVDKSTILSEKDIDLSQELYREYTLPSDKVGVFSELGDMITEEKGKVKSLRYPIWSVSNSLGFVPSEEYFGNQVASEDISSYKLVPPGCFAYNPARINVGSVALNNTLETGAVSPMYTVFRLRNDKLEAEALLAFLKSPQALFHIKRLSHGTVRQQLRFKDLKRLLVISDSAEFNRLVSQQNNLILENERKIAQCKDAINSKIEEIWGSNPST